MQIDLNSLIGKTILEAKVLTNLPLRITKIDGVGQFGDCRFNVNRINIEIFNEKIVAAKIG